MENTSLIALSRQAALRRQMAVVANNIANMNTVGFQGERMMFVDHLVRSRGGERLLGEKLAFTRDIATMRDTAEGPVRQTGNPFDLAVRNGAYFVIETPQGERYTRNGRFQLDEAGQVVTQHGFPVLTEGGGPLILAPDDREVTISRDGTVATRNGELGRLRVVKFENEQQLRPVAGGYFQAPPDATPTADEPARRDVVQGALEDSNVQGVVEMTRMIEVHRAYDTVRKLIEVEDQRMKRMSEELSKPV
ncbi:MAG: flagellar basal-body rod protein FlgF [Hyphomicrobiales bacterium]|nr:flagellar basal-body rod protein FlgF [Hyphomicrobiales bacterium]MCP5373612.1 flagellar basal-body rod protein FlgF [Hyphomicrobiales bacterium]